MSLFRLLSLSNGTFSTGLCVREKGNLTDGVEETGLSFFGLRAVAAVWKDADFGIKGLSSLILLAAIVYQVANALGNGTTATTYR